MHLQEKATDLHEEARSTVRHSGERASRNGRIVSANPRNEEEEGREMRASNVSKAENEVNEMKDLLITMRQEIAANRRKIEKISMKPIQAEIVKKNVVPTSDKNAIEPTKSLIDATFDAFRSVKSIMLSTPDSASEPRQLEAIEGDH